MTAIAPTDRALAVGGKHDEDVPIDRDLEDRASLDAGTSELGRRRRAQGGDTEPSIPPHSRALPLLLKAMSLWHQAPVHNVHRAGQAETTTPPRPYTAPSFGARRDPLHRAVRLIRERPVERGSRGLKRFYVRDAVGTLVGCEKKTAAHRKQHLVVNLISPLKLIRTSNNEHIFGVGDYHFDAARCRCAIPDRF